MQKCVGPCEKLLVNLIWKFRHLTNLLSHFCQISTCPDQTRQAAEQKVCRMMKMMIPWLATHALHASKTNKIYAANLLNELYRMYLLLSTNWYISNAPSHLYVSILASSFLWTRKVPPVHLCNASFPPWLSRRPSGHRIGLKWKFTHGWRQEAKKVMQNLIMIEMKYTTFSTLFGELAISENFIFQVPILNINVGFIN